jgi:hypothetical protein
MGAILTGASSKVIEDGARACYKRAKDGTDMAEPDSTHREATVTRGDVHYECALVSTSFGYGGSFDVDIFRRDGKRGD